MALSADEKRARNAAKQRAYRARRRAEREAAASTKPATGGNGDEIPSTMRDALADAIQHMKWIAPSDGASVAQAKQLADDIDRFHHEGDYAKALSAHRALSRVLNDLGGTPNVRLARELRSLKGTVEKPEEGDGGTQSAGAEQPANVTQLKRPPKRRA